jgi:hypothetical protein
VERLPFPGRRLTQHAPELGKHVVRRVLRACAATSPSPGAAAPGAAVAPPLLSRSSPALLCQSRRPSVARLPGPEPLRHLGVRQRGHGRRTNPAAASGLSWSASTKPARVRTVAIVKAIAACRKKTGESEGSSRVRVDAPQVSTKLLGMAARPPSGVKLEGPLPNTTQRPKRCTGLPPGQGQARRGGQRPLCRQAAFSWVQTLPWLVPGATRQWCRQVALSALTCPASGPWAREVGLPVVTRQAVGPCMLRVRKPSLDPSGWAKAPGPLTGCHCTPKPKCRRRTLPRGGCPVAR